MTLKELYDANINFYSPIEVRSGYNGKILCQKFDPQKHKEIAKRELISMWADTKKSNNDSGWIYTVLCCYVDGNPECEKGGY